MITIMHALPMSSNTDAHHSMPPIHAVATELSVAPCFRPLYFGVHWHPANHHHRGSANHRVHWADLPLGTTGEEFRRWCDGIVPRVQQFLQAVMMASPGQASSLQGSHGGTVAMQLVHMEKTNPPYIYLYIHVRQFSIAIFASAFITFLFALVAYGYLHGAALGTCANVR